MLCLIVSNQKMYRETELRKLPSGFLYSIVDIFETNQDWKKVMSYIPKDPNSATFEPKYTSEHIRLIEDHSKISGKRCTEILLEEWGTSGRVRPTLTTLKQVSIQAHIFRAADAIAIMNNEELPVRPTDGPAASIDTGITSLLNTDTYSKSLNNKITKKISNVCQSISNKTTAQMKSASNLIQFSSNSTNLSPAEIPNISAFHSQSNKTTAQMKSDTDFIKFSEKELRSTTVPELKTAELPNFSAIIGHTDCNAVSDRSDTTSGTTISQSSDKSSQETSSTLPIQDAEEMADLYQTSLPNLEFHSRSGIHSSILRDNKLVHFKYETLKLITDNFSPKLTTDEKGPIGLIGSGGFGEVFVCYHEKYGHLAVKKTHKYLFMLQKPDLAMKVFNAEVSNLSKLNHKNIVPIRGISIDGPALCIVCEYIDGGSLEEKIAAKTLSEKQRLDIMIGTADGLKYLHGTEKTNDNDIYKTSETTDSQNSKKNNFIHGDIKSANILLTKECVPKLCDFGLAKQFDTTYTLSSPMGTSAYMAPEGFHGTITQKIDVFGFGIVLLELLTGLKPIVEDNNEKLNIKDYVEEKLAASDLEIILDPAEGNWRKASEIYQLAVLCLDSDRKKRPAVQEVCDQLNTIRSSISQW